MLKQAITYTDFDGEERTEEFYFNFTEAEIQEQNLKTPGGLEKRLKKIAESKDQAQIVEYFKSLILDSYGEKSDDGRKFIKVRDGKRLSEEFEQTAAYNKLFMLLSTNTEAAIRFVNGIIPNPNGIDLEKEMRKQIEESAGVNA